MDVSDEDIVKSVVTVLKEEYPGITKYRYIRVLDIDNTLVSDDNISWKKLNKQKEGK